MKQLITIAALVVLSGCVADGPDLTDELCGAGQLSHLIGQSADALNGLDLSENRRVLRPGMAYTEDYQPDRLNISIDENEVIERIWCS